MSYYYDDYLTQLTSNTEVSESEIFNYAGLPYQGLCDQLFQAFQFHLENNLKLFTITPAIFFFNNCTDINAWAWKSNGTYIISFNIGVIHKLRLIFLEVNVDELLLQVPELEEYRTIEKPLKTPLNELFYSASTIYLFYHEAGHLVQFSYHNSKAKISEQASKTSVEFNIIDHVFELDCDLFAGIRISEHILYNWEKLSSDEKTIENLERMIIISSVGVGLYRMMHIEYSNEIYYEQHTHPHIIIRTFGVIHTIVDHAKLHSEKFMDLNLNFEKMLKQTLILLDKLLPIILGDKSRINFINIYSGEEERVLQYYDKLASLINSEPATSIYQRNLAARKNGT